MPFRKCDRMDREDELDTKIRELESKKAVLIERIKKLNGRLRYKQYELKALEPFLKATENIRIGPLRKKLRIMEFKIATQAYTPQIERDMVKSIRKMEKELEEVRDVERARRKKQLVEKDIEETKKGIETIELDLRSIREELGKLHAEMRDIRSAKKKNVVLGPVEDMVTLGEIGIIEEKKKK